MILQWKEIFEFCWKHLKVGELYFQKVQKSHFWLGPPYPLNFVNILYIHCFTIFQFLFEKSTQELRKIVFFLPTTFLLIPSKIQNNTVCLQVSLVLSNVFPLKRNTLYRTVVRRCVSSYYNMVGFQGVTFGGITLYCNQ